MSEAQEKRVIGKHACERCRKAKTRCFVDTLEEFGKCRKCHATGVECEWKQIATTRRRKRTDARVTELEKQIAGLETALTSLKAGDSSLSTQAYTQTSDSGLEVTAHTSLSPSASHEHESGSSSYGRESIRGIVLEEHTVADTENLRNQETLHSTSDDYVTVIGAIGYEFTSLTQSIKSTLLDAFVTKLLPEYPVIAIEAADTLPSVEEKHPVLAAAMIAAASSSFEPKLFKSLHLALIKYLTDRVIIQGHRNLELLQAVLISATWFHPPDRLENLNVYQWTHIAGTMALELGLGGKTSTYANRRIVAAFAGDGSEKTMAMFRTMFAVYLTCSRVAVSFRRQRTISFSPFTSDAVEIFSQRANNDNDRRLVAWIRLQSIAEDIESMKLNAELQTASNPTERQSVKNDLSLFLDRLHEWESSIDATLLNGALKVDFCFCKTKLYELAICLDQDLDDLSVPQLAFAKLKARATPQKTALNPIYVRAILSFVSGCHSIFEAILTIDVVILRGCPILTFFRIAYAFKALVLLRRCLADPEHSISSIVDDETLRWRHYVESISRHVESASTGGVYAGPAFALKIRDSARHFARMDGTVEYPGQWVTEVPTFRGHTPTSDDYPISGQEQRGLHGPDVTQEAGTEPEPYTTMDYQMFLDEDWSVFGSDPSIAFASWL